ncbi:MAG TPA: PIG-L family deacetylase [Bacteroidales bacterium]|nr:PIG-L family deacetylase [Bacteroidales bacterium]
MSSNSVLAIFAHPDDAEIMCAGTLALLKKKGLEINIATMTGGDKGSATLSRDEISRIRKTEGVVSASLIGGAYYCLGFQDIYLFYNSETINRTVELIRNVKPSIVFTASPSDYMVDHEMTSRIVQTACFCAGIKNMEAGGEPLGYVPHLYYTDAMDAKDILGRRIDPGFYIDISDAMDIKEKMLASHKSQRDWLLKHHKIDEYIISMKRFGEMRGSEVNKKYAEGYRQHLGHGYPQDNILEELLASYLIKTKN